MLFESSVSMLSPAASFPLPPSCVAAGVELSTKPGCMTASVKSTQELAKQIEFSLGRQYWLRMVISKSCGMDFAVVDRAGYEVFRATIDSGECGFR